MNWIQEWCLPMAFTQAAFGHSFPIPTRTKASCKIRLLLLDVWKAKHQRDYYFEEAVFFAKGGSFFKKCNCKLNWQVILPGWLYFVLKYIFMKVQSLICARESSWNFYSVLEQIWIEGSYLDQRLPQHESLYHIGLKSARIEIPYIGSHYIDFSKTDFY